MQTTTNDVINVNTVYLYGSLTAIGEKAFEYYGKQDDNTRGSVAVISPGASITGLANSGLIIDDPMEE